MQNTNESSYVRKIYEMWQTGALPREAGYHQISVFHDDWCALLNGKGPCDCNPDIALRWSLPGHDN